MHNILKGRGGDSGGGSSRTPVEAPDNLLTKQIAEGIDVICEGEIEGFAILPPTKSIYINDVPLEANISGSSEVVSNYNSFIYDYKYGTQTQNLLSINSTSFNNVETAEVTNLDTTIIKKGPSGQHDFVYQVPNGGYDFTRITLAVDRLVSQDTSTGDINGSKVTVKFWVSEGNKAYKVLPTNFIWSSVSILTSQTQLLDLFTTTTGVRFSILWNGFQSGYTLLYDENGVPSAFGNPKEASFRVEFSTNSGTNWSTLYEGTIAESPVNISQVVDENGSLSYAINGVVQPRYPWQYTGSIIPGDIVITSIDFTNLTEASTYSFKVTKLSGEGAISFNEIYRQTRFNELTIEGKTTSTYTRDVLVPLESYSHPIYIKITRETEDSTSSNISNNIRVGSLTNIIRAKLRYPNSALVGYRIDASQFNSIPKRGYHIKGRKVRIPSNYNPNTREYIETTPWDGTFTDATYTNNPVWCFLDLLTNKRFGLGDHIDINSDYVNLNKFALYNIAKYCDEPVAVSLSNDTSDSLRVAIEPRFTCNLYIQTREEAYKLLSNFASIFRSMIYWGTGTIQAVADMPSDPIAEFNNSNIIEGQFSYSGSSIKVRHNVALVSYNDPLFMYEQRIEYVEDIEDIAKYGVKSTELHAFGCTSRSQAQRVGRWLLYSEKHETEVISFKAFMDASYIRPGEIIRVLDTYYARVKYGGRVLSGTTASSIKIDKAINFTSGIVYSINCVLPNGNIETRTINNLSGSHDTLPLSSALSAIPQELSIWTLQAESGVQPRLFRVVSIVEEQDKIFSISALEHDQDKFNFIEKDIIIPDKIYSASSSVGPIDNTIKTYESQYLLGNGLVGYKLHVSWDPPTTSCNGYEVYYRLKKLNTDGYTNKVFLTSKTNNIEIENIVTGYYEIGIRGISYLGTKGNETVTTVEVFGKIQPPKDVTGLYYTIENNQVVLHYDSSTEYDVQTNGYLLVRFSTSNTWSKSVFLNNSASGISTSVTVPYIPYDASYPNRYYLVKWVDSGGLESNSAASIQLLTSDESQIQIQSVASVTDFSTNGGTNGLVYVA